MTFESCAVMARISSWERCAGNRPYGTVWKCLRALSEVLAVPELEARAMAGIEQALPWVTWLVPEDRLEFATSFVRTVRACHDIGNYEPLTRLLGRWKASAQIANDPELVASFNADRGVDEIVRLARPVE